MNLRGGGGGAAVWWVERCSEAAGFSEWQSGADSPVPCGFVNGDDGGAGFDSGKEDSQELKIANGVGVIGCRIGGVVGEWSMESDGYLGSGWFGVG